MGWLGWLLIIAESKIILTYVGISSHTQKALDLNAVSFMLR